MRKLPKIIVSAIVEKDNRILLIKEVLESGKELWIVPGGTAEFGETLEQAVRRELKEETNIDIGDIEYLHFKEVVRTQFDYHTVIFFFRAVPRNEEIVPGNKILDARFFDKNEIAGLQLVDSAEWILEKYFSSKEELPA